MPTTTVKTSELTGAALDWCVRYANSGFFPKDYVEARDNFSTCWNKGGSIIEREGINLRSIRKEGHSMNSQWLAAYDEGNTGALVQWVKRKDWPRHYLSGPTPLIAAMRCYCASKLGDTVEVPKELA